MINVVIWKKPNVSWIHPINIDNCINANNFNSDYLDTLNKLRNSSLRILELRDITEKISDGPFGSQLKVEEYKENGFPVYRVKNIINTQILEDDIVYIDAKKQQQLKRSEVLPGDVLITKAGRIGSAAVVPSKLGNGNITSHLVLVRLKKLVNNYFLVAYLESIYGKAITKRESYKSTRPELTKAEIENVIIPIPSPEIQKYIGDKVRKAEELREEAKRLKKEAEKIINESLNFRQLDLLYKGSKVKFKWISTNVLTDRIDGNYYEQKYVETINHIRRNSKKYITLNSIIDSIYTGKKPMYDEKGTEAYFVQSGNISSNFLEIDNKEKVDLSKYNQVLFGDLLIAKDGETIGKIAINLTNEIIIINEHTYCVRLKEKYKYYPAYIYYLLINDYINPLIRREATGSAQKGLNFSFAENIIIPILEEDIIINLYNLELRRCNNIYKSKQLIQEAKKDVEDLIEGNFDISKVKANN